MVAGSTKAGVITATDGGRCENTVTGWWMVVNDKHYSFWGWR